MPTEQQISRINDVLYKIHRDTSAELSGHTLSQVAAYSEQHFHRIFHQVVGESVHQYVRRTRLEQAANQLMFDRKRPIIEIAEQCGFASLSSFSKAFKDTFGLTPGRWRTQDHDTTTPTYSTDEEIETAYRKLHSTDLPIPNLVELPDQPVAYVRHLGYGRGIRQAWQTLQAWAAAEGRPFGTQLGLHHSNPTWVPLEQCRYVACLAIDKPVLRRGIVNSMCIPSGLHAAFDLTGGYGELLPYLSKILDHWLPSSGFRAKTTPAFVHYRKNQFLEPDERFDLTFYLPISFW